MKNIAFVFEKISQNLPQIEWAIAEYIQPYVHRIVLIFLMPERWIPMNDPGAMLLVNCITTQEEIYMRREIIKFLRSVDNKIKSEFGDNIDVTKLVLYGNERYKLDASLTCLKIELVILGPDTKSSRWSNFIFKSIDSFIVDNVGVSTVRVPNIYAVKDVI